MAMGEKKDKNDLSIDSQTTTTASPTGNAFPPKPYNGHDAAAAEALVAGEKPLMTDDEIRLAQMPTGIRLYLIMLGLMLYVHEYQIVESRLTSRAVLSMSSPSVRLARTKSRNS
jgi:hypothetical protein